VTHVGLEHRCGGCIELNEKLDLMGARLAEGERKREQMEVRLAEGARKREQMEARLAEGELSVIIGDLVG
jgi:hypothetical protein